jgi:hypothetical protein
VQQLNYTSFVVYWPNFVWRLLEIELTTIVLRVAKNDGSWAKAVEHFEAIRPIVSIESSQVF